MQKSVSCFIFVINLDHFVEIYVNFDIKGSNWVLISVKKSHIYFGSVLWDNKI